MRPVTGLLSLLLLLVTVGVTATAQEEISSDADEKSDHDTPVTQAHRHLWTNIDQQVKNRYMADPPGFRKHPSYYSESYLPRGRETSESETRELANERGAWTLVDDKRSSRPGDDFYANYANRDVPFADFPANAWQKDTDYLGKFLTEAVDLTKRAMEAYVLLLDKLFACCCCC